MSCRVPRRRKGEKTIAPSSRHVWTPYRLESCGARRAAWPTAPGFATKKNRSRNVAHHRSLAPSLSTPSPSLQSLWANADEWGSLPCRRIRWRLEPRRRPMQPQPRRKRPEHANFRQPPRPGPRRPCLLGRRRRPYLPLQPSPSARQRTQVIARLSLSLRRATTMGMPPCRSRCPEKALLPVLRRRDRPRPPSGVGPSQMLSSLEKATRADGEGAATSGGSDRLGSPSSGHKLRCQASLAASTHVSTSAAVTCASANCHSGTRRSTRGAIRFLQRRADERTTHGSATDDVDRPATQDGGYRADSARAAHESTGGGGDHTHAQHR